MSAARACRLAVVGGVAGLVLLTGCSSSPSYAALAKIAHQVPVPARLTYVREVDHFNHAAFGNGGQKEVDLIYNNTTMTCDQLSAAWLNALKEAHRKIQSGAGTTVMYLKADGVPITVDAAGIAGTSSCTQPRVAVGKTP